LSPEKTWSRKLDEIALAAIIETKLSKPAILEQYINTVYVGTRNGVTINGLGQAAQLYFGHDASHVNAQEAALLARRVQRPGYFAPIRRTDGAIARRNLVLKLMRENNIITEGQRAQAAKTKLSIAPAETTGHDDEWFLEMAADEVRRASKNL